MNKQKLRIFICTKSNQKIKERKHPSAIPTPKITYLGINLAIKVKVLYEKNFKSFLKDLK